MVCHGAWGGGERCLLRGNFSPLQDAADLVLEVLKAYIDAV